MKDKQIVLVVDDEPKILELVKSYLEMSGYKAGVCQMSRWFVQGNGLIS